MNLVFDSAFLPTIHKPTRVTHSTATLIDNIFVKNKTVQSHKSYIIIDPRSDHFPCLLSYVLLDDDTNKSNCQYFEKRKLNEESMLKIQQDLLFFDWSTIGSMTIDNSYKFLIDSITSVMDKHAPKKIVKIINSEKFREPWMTVSIKRANAKARTLCKKAKETGLQKDIDRYKLYRNMLNRIKLHEKRIHYTELFKKIGRNSQLLWNIINNLVKKTSNKMHIIELLQNNEIVKGDANLCNVFNDHFSTAGSRVRDSIKANANATNHSLLGGRSLINRVNANLRFEPISEQYLCKLVAKMKPKKSCGLDDVSNMLLKNLISVIKQPLCELINNSLMTGEFPDLMKIAKVMPLYKNGDKLLPDNYRPISLLPVLSKLLEKVVYVKLTEHLDKHQILYNRQFGF